MRALLKLPAALPDWVGTRVTRTPEGAAMADIPDWLIMIDPSYKDATKFLNRAAVGKSCPLREPVGAPPGTGTFPNGQPAFVPANNGGLNINTASYVDENVDIVDFTVFATLHRTGATSAAPYIWAPQGSSTTGQRSFSLAILTGTHLPAVRQLSGGSSATIISGTEITVNLPHLVLMSYSTARGLTLRQNGAEVARAAAEAAPNRPASISQMGTFLNAESTSGLRYGISGIINRDLTASANAIYLARLEGYLMSRYGIGA